MITSSETNKLAKKGGNRLQRDQTIEHISIYVSSTVQAVPTNQTQWENNGVEDEYAPDLIDVMEWVQLC